jgi:hypothetical protein
MTYILSTDLDFEGMNDWKLEDYEKFQVKFNEYRKYLKSLKNKIPNSAYKFANADWHYDTGDARCPHDAWLEELKFGEVYEEKGKFEFKSAELYLKLLGAYHNGHLEIVYKNLREYSFKGFKDYLAPQKLNGFIHHDWLRDEIRLSETGNVIHEIEWVNAHWLIECEDIESNWISFDENQTTDMSIDRN